MSKNDSKPVECNQVVCIDPAMYANWAATFQGSQHHLTLWWYRAEFYKWKDGRYAVLPDHDVQAQVRRWFTHEMREGRILLPSDKQLQFEEIVAALQALVYIPSDTETPCWLEGDTHVPIDQLIVCTNGILPLKDRNLIATTPMLLNFNVGHPHDQLAGGGSAAKEACN